jgi:hypothetical protein
MPRGHILKWAYDKNHDRLHCELAFNPNALTYEFTTSRNHSDTTRRVEYFRSVTHAFLYQAAFEARVIGRGWSFVDYAAHQSSDKRRLRR